MYGPENIARSEQIINCSNCNLGSQQLYREFHTPVSQTRCQTNHGFRDNNDILFRSVMWTLLNCLHDNYFSVYMLCLSTGLQDTCNSVVKQFSVYCEDDIHPLLEHYSLRNFLCSKVVITAQLSNQ